MNIEVIPAENLTGKERQDLQRLTFRGYSGMREYLQKWGDTPGAAKVIRLTDDGGSILSWGLMVRERYNKSQPWFLQVYTRRSARRQGYGTLVYRRAAQVAQGGSKLRVDAHDNKSTAFFDKMKTKKGNTK